jgi:hypothetical protein
MLGRAILRIWGETNNWNVANASLGAVDPLTITNAPNSLLTVTNGMVAPWMVDYYGRCFLTGPRPTFLSVVIPRRESYNTGMTSEGKNSAAFLWQGAGLWYLGFCLAGVAAGLWPEAILPSKAGPRPLPLPTLGTLALAQAAFFLLVYPLVIFRRCDGGSRCDGGQRYDCAAAIPGRRVRKKIGCVPIFGETVVLLIVSAPFYYVSAYLADAVPVDAFRAVIGVACLIPLSWSAAAWLCRGGLWRAAAGVLLLVAALGLPAATYIAAETLKPEWADALWRFSPATFLWQNCDSRLAGVLPRPLWTGVIYLALAAVMFLLTLMSKSSASQEA